jgi:hypothetical protein
VAAPFLTLPRLIRAGHVFALETGEPWTAIQCSDFNLPNRWQHGEDVTPILAQRAGAGFNLLRCWTHYDLSPGIGTFLDIDYNRIPAFLSLCASFGLRVEFTAYTSIERFGHWERLVEACQGEPSVLLELVNEGTLPVNQIDMQRYAKPTQVLTSRGSGGAEGVPPWEPWDYVTFHTNGSNEEQRKVGHNAMEIWSGPTLTNETSRYPDVGMWVGASVARQQQLAYDSAAGAALLCAGSCFHSQQGKTSVLWDDRTLAVALAWSGGAKSVPLAYQHQPYVHRQDRETPGVLRAYQRGTSPVVPIRV